MADETLVIVIVASRYLLFRKLEGETYLSRIYEVRGLY